MFVAMGVQRPGERLGSAIVDPVARLARLVAAVPHRGEHKRRLVRTVGMPAREPACPGRENALVRHRPREPPVIAS
jgi:hypothetical protein